MTSERSQNSGSRRPAPTAESQPATRTQLDALRKAQIGSCLSTEQLATVADGAYRGDDPIIKLPPQRDLVAGLIVANAYRLPIILRARLGR